MSRVGARRTVAFMLTAMLESKGRRVPQGVNAGDPLRQVLLRSEDLLTATVFERLVYLRGSTLWRVLAASFSPALPDATEVELEAVMFWPWWDEAYEVLGKSVEPDLVLRFVLGPAATPWTLIVEAKLDQKQAAQQWAEQWIAYQHASADKVDGEQVRLLAIGGVAERPLDTVHALTLQAVGLGAVGLCAAAADWRDLLRALMGCDWANSAEQRIITDLIEALGLFGFRPLRPLTELVALARLHPIRPAAIAAFNRA